MLTALLVPTLAAWNNVVVPRLPGPAYTAVNAAATGALLGAARAAGLSWAELGLDRSRWRAGARSGAALAAPLAAGYGIALAVPALRPVLLDARVAPMSARRVAAEAVLRIPVGTVLWEEAAFRGVLYALLGRLLSPRAGPVAGALLFGVWHVRPTLAAVSANRPTATAWQRSVAVVVGCSGTGAAGALLGALRRRSGSLLAPVLLHLTANVLGLLAAAAAHRLHTGCESGTGARRGAGTTARRTRGR